MHALQVREIYEQLTKPSHLAHLQHEAVEPYVDAVERKTLAPSTYGDRYKGPTPQGKSRRLTREEVDSEAQSY